MFKAGKMFKLLNFLVQLLRRAATARVKQWKQIALEALHYSQAKQKSFVNWNFSHRRYFKSTLRKKISIWICLLLEKMQQRVR